MIPNAAARPIATPTTGQRQAVADEHAGDRLGLRAERDADADLARALRDGVGNHAVDPRHAEQQRHAAGDAEHHQRERRPRQRRVVDLLQRAHARQRQVRIDRPHRAAQFVGEPAGSRSGCCEPRTSRRARLGTRVGRLRLKKSFISSGQYADRRRLLVQAVVAHVADARRRLRATAPFG